MAVEPRELKFIATEEKGGGVNFVMASVQTDTHGARHFSVYEEREGTAFIQTGRREIFAARSFWH